MDGKFLIRVAKFSEGLLERPLDDDERNDLKYFVDENFKFIEDKRSVVQVAELASAYADRVEGLADMPDDSHTEDLKRDPFTGDTNDLEEIDTDMQKKVYLQNQDLNLVSFLGLDTFDKFISELNPNAKRKRAYMCLDSRYARFNKDCTRLTWDFTNNLNVINNSTNVVGPVRDITWIRMHSMVVRKFDSVPQRATILIEELSAQAFIMPSGRRFHFVGLLNDLQNPINFGNRNALIGPSQGVPDFTIFDKYELLAGYKFNEGYYRFNKPITTLNEITVSVGNPDTLVVLPKYEFKEVTVIDAQGMFLDLELNEPHHYISPNSSYSFASGTWYSVFVDGFSSSNPFYDDVMNTTEFTVVQILSPTRIRLLFQNAPAGFHGPFPPSIFPQFPPPITIPPIPNLARTVRFNSYRIIMNFELEYISN